MLVFAAMDLDEGNFRYNFVEKSAPWYGIIKDTDSDTKIEVDSSRIEEIERKKHF